MTRYFFHTHNSIGLVRDEEGQELEGSAAAHNVAVVSIRSIIAEEALNGELNLQGKVEIVDEHGALLETVPFSSAFRLNLGNPH